MSECHATRVEKLIHLIFALLPAMLRPLRGSFCLWEPLLFAARSQAPDSVGKRLLYLLSHFTRVIVFHLLNKVIGENPTSSNIPRRPRKSNYVDHEASSCCVTSLRTVACALPLNLEC
jgi:hypothetical protein